LEWIRGNTPVAALFALDPRHMELPGEDENGFRARAERGMLADLVKDKGACSMFPATLGAVGGTDRGTEEFREVRKRRLQTASTEIRSQLGSGGAAWPAGMACPYQNSAVRVCRVD
jgi:hypothetical protein